jgi:cell division protease FtsH
MHDKFNEFIKKLKEALKKLKSDKKLMAQFICSVVLFLTVLSIAITSYSEYPLESKPIETISYNEFLELVDNGDVDTVYYSGSEEYMTVTLYNDETRDMTDEELEDYTYKNEDKRKVLYPAYDEFRKDLLEKGVKLSILTGKATLIEVLSTLLTLALPILWIVIILKMFSGQTKGMDEKTLIQTSDKKFSDVIGQDEIMDDIKFYADLIKNSDLGSEVGANIPKGIMLTGEPGTGKTLIAKAIAGEAGVPFLSVDSSSFIEMFVGLGARRVRDVFKIAKKHAPCIVFFDEIDAVGQKRDGVGRNSEDDQTINALLQCMDGFTGRDGVFVIGATNRYDKLDPALTRAGRFDRMITISKPRDWKVRVDLFNHFLEKFSIDESVDVEVIAKQVSGFTGADIEALCNEAGIIAVMHGKHAIDMECMEEAVDKKVFNGNRAKEEHFIEDKKIVAYHEAGHAVETWLTGEEISRASIIATTSGVGGAVFGADSDTSLHTKSYFENRIKICYAGRASEEIKFKEITTGASNDIQQATGIIKEYITGVGFSSEFGLLDLDTLSKNNIVNQTAYFDLMQNMSKDLYNKTLTDLKDNYIYVETLAQKLLECETLSGKAIEELFNSIKKEED